MDYLLDIPYLLNALRRRWLLIVVPATLGAGLALVVAFALPPVYQSSARIIVESQQIPEELVRTTVTTNAAQRIRLIEERLKTRQNLLELADRYDVFRGQDSLSASDRVDRMRAATEIRMLGAARRRRAQADTTLTTFEVVFSASDAAIASQVANELLTQVLAENTEQRNTRASETRLFFESEAQRLAGELAALETEIVNFRRANELSLPDQIDFRRAELAELQREVFAAEARRVALLDTRRQILAAMAAGRSTTAQRRPEQVELERLQAAFRRESAIYASTHPVIRNLEAQIAALRASLTPPEVARTVDLPTPESSGVGGPEDIETLGSDASIPATAPELTRIDAEIALLEEKQERQEARVEELTAALERAPDVSIEIGRLMRNYSTLQSQYESVIRKRSEAETSERLEVSQQAERFEVIELPRPPERPVSPNRPFIAGAGAVISVGFGFGLALLLELLHPTIRTARDLERRFGMAALAVMPTVVSQRERTQRKWMLRIAAIAVLAVIPAALWYADQRIAPLSVVAERALDRLGVSNTLTLIMQRLEK